MSKSKYCLSVKKLKILYSGFNYCYKILIKGFSMRALALFYCFSIFASLHAGRKKKNKIETHSNIACMKDGEMVKLQQAALKDFIEKVNVNDLDIDYHGLYNLHNLQSAILSIKNNKQHLDYSYFKNLNYLSVDWYSQFPNLSKNKRLKELIIWKFKPKTANFNELRGMEQLESLKITQSNITSFMGMENFVELKKFEGYYLSNLESLNGINKVSKHIKVLVLEKCKKLINYQSNLEKLRVLEKLILTDCGQLQNLKFINNLERLKFFSFLGTNVKDGNLFPLERNRLDYFSFNNSPHYSHKIDTDNTFKKK